jgi:hypothetical protein
MIKCSKCGEDKDVCEFRERPSLKRGYHSWCKECERKANRKRNAFKPKSIRVNKVKDPDNIKLSAKKRMLKHRYSLEYDEYMRMYESQNGECGICGDEKILGGHGGLLIDHCHENNNVRGLLCTNCNSGLGKFKDDITILSRAINYLKIHTENSKE